MARQSLAVSGVQTLGNGDVAGLVAACVDVQSVALEAYNTLSSINISGLSTAQLAGITSAIVATGTLRTVLDSNMVVTVDTSVVTSVSTVRALTNKVQQNLLGRSLAP
jgi:hypothetical protein